MLHTSATVTAVGVGGAAGTCAMMGVVPPPAIIIKALMASVVPRTMRAANVMPGLDGTYVRGGGGGKENEG